MMKTTMDIYARRGTKVRYLDKNGHDWEKDKCRALGLKKGDILTVNYTGVGNWSTRVYFDEYPNYSFNSVMFKDYIENKKEDMRTVQFNHERHYDSKGNLKAKGGRTIALEVPTTEEFNNLTPDVFNKIQIKIGVAKCSDKDHYNKKRGRDIAKGRMTEVNAVVTLVSASEVQIVTEIGITLILKKTLVSGRIFFHEVV